MTFAEILQIVSTLISAGTLSVSVLVFINTIRKTQLEKRQNLATEKFNAFLKSIENYFILVSPQDSYDLFAIVYYSDGNYNYTERYAQIKRLDSDIIYKLEEVKLFAPDEFTETCSIIEELNQIKTDISQINAYLCADIHNKSQGMQYEYRDQILQLQNDYLDKYDVHVNNVFNTLHTIRNAIVYKNE